MGKKEIFSLAAAIGFILIWIIDLNSPTPAEVKGQFWGEIFYHYGWLMYGVGCLFYYQFAKNERIKKEKEQDGSK
ncbi:hypothetical protein SKC35_08720 [Aquirufa sp. KTFRIE-69F]|jgi:hypothetical protein|uniref:DUF3311 domain-containing protein n=1 Tax=Aquirufa originis TaxID=3096514 RepID=A0ABW6D6W7_9BACT